MKRLYRALGILLCCTILLSLSALASSIGQVSGKSTLTLTPPKTVRGSFTSTENQAPASDIFKIYVKGEIVEAPLADNVVVAECENEKSGVKTVTASCSAQGKNGYSYGSWGTHITMYRSGVDPDYYTSAGGPVDVFFSRTSGQDSESILTDENICQQVFDTCGVDLNDLAFVSFEYLWMRNEDELDSMYEPLKTMLIDEFVLTGVGEGLPSGVYYDAKNAYIVRSIGNGQFKLVHCLTDTDSFIRLVTADDEEYCDEEGRIFNGRTYTVLNTYVLE